MANHSLIRLKTPVEPEVIERVVAEINERRFEGRLRLSSPEGLTEQWAAERAWLIVAPDSHPPKEAGPFDPDEDLGFCFWLKKGGQIIETRHALQNRWMRWIMHIHEHELAKHFGIERFNGGDGTVLTLPEQYKTNFFDYAIHNYAKPLSDRDKRFIQQHFFNDVPEAYRAGVQPESGEPQSDHPEEGGHS